MSKDLDPGPARKQPSREGVSCKSRVKHLIGLQDFGVKSREREINRLLNQYVRVWETKAMEINQYLGELDGMTVAGTKIINFRLHSNYY